MASTHKCTQEQSISFITKSYADMDKKIDTVINSIKDTNNEIKDMRKEIKDTYATKEELEATATLQDLKNATMGKDIDKLNDIISKLARVLALAVIGSVIANVIK